MAAQTGEIGKHAQTSVNKDRQQNVQNDLEKLKISGPNDLSKCPESREMDFIFEKHIFRLFFEKCRNCKERSKTCRKHIFPEHV